MPIHSHRTHPPHKLNLWATELVQIAAKPEPASIPGTRAGEEGYPPTATPTHVNAHQMLQM